MLAELLLHHTLTIDNIVKSSNFLWDIYLNLLLAYFVLLVTVRVASSYTAVRCTVRSAIWLSSLLAECVSTPSKVPGLNMNISCHDVVSHIEILTAAMHGAVG